MTLKEQRDNIKQCIKNLNDALSNSEYHLVHNIDMGVVNIVRDGIDVGDYPEEDQREVTEDDSKYVDYCELELGTITDWQKYILTKKTKAKK